MNDLNMNDLIEAAAGEEDHTKVTAGGNFTAPAPGKTVARFIEYIELGMQPQSPYMGKPKPPQEEVKLTFELLGPKRDLHEHEGKVYADKISFRVTKQFGDKAKFKKLFNQMDAGRGYKHMAQMLGQAFIVDVFNAGGKKREDGSVGRVYATLFNAEHSPSVSMPVVIDPLTQETTAIPVREQISPSKVFLWQRPTKDCWSSIYIDGEREVKAADGTVRMESKNFIQETIRKALNFQGSATEMMLMSLGANMPDTPPAQAQADLAAPVQAAAATQAEAGQKAAGAAQDALKDLGF